MISDTHRAIFVHIQKTGGDSVSYAFGQPRNSPEKHRTAAELRNIYGEEAWSTYFKFSFVRNPWDRLVSWWAMIDGHRERFQAGAKLNLFQTYILENANTFEEFLLNCDQEIVDSDGSKAIFRNQLDYLTAPSGELLVDYIGRFERLSTDFEHVAGCLSVRPAPLPHVNKSAHRPYTDHYTPALVDLVAQRYARDIERFGYTFGS